MVNRDCWLRPWWSPRGAGRGRWRCCGRWLRWSPRIRSTRG